MTSSSISHMWCYDAYFLTNYVIMMSQWRIRDEVCVIAPHMRNKKTTFLILCRFVFSLLRILSLFSRLNTPKVWPYMVIWREIWIYLITCNIVPFYPIEMGFSPEIIEFYEENYYWIFNTSFLNFLSDAKFGHHRVHNMTSQYQSHGIK